VYSKSRHGKGWLNIKIDLEPNAQQSACRDVPNYPYYTNAGDIRLFFAYPRISPRCLLNYVLSVIFVIAIFGGCSSEAKGPKYEIFPPAGGKGAIVVVASGNSGPGLYRDFSSKLAALGYYTVLMDGKYLFDPGSIGLIVPAMENLQAVIAESKSSPQAIPGKVSLVGFSVGGAGVLAYGTKLKEQVSAVVAYYPAITTLGRDMKTLAAGFQTPVLVFAGEEDRYHNCCLIESMRDLAKAPKSVPFELVEYPEAHHGFDIKSLPFAYRASGRH
jgi:predicted esterase